MTEIEYKQFKDFINKLIYEKMTLDDYEIVMNRLKVPTPIKNNDTVWMYKSICHNINPNDCKNNLAFYTETKTFYCFSECQVSYNIITLVEKRFELLGESKTRFNCVKWICEQLHIPFSFNSDVEQPKNYKYNWQNSLGKYLKNANSFTELKVYDKSILDYFPKQYHQSWFEDNIQECSMEKYGIRYYPYHDSVIIPCLDSKGQLIGIRERFLNPNLTVKYLPLSMLDGTSYEFPVNRVMYGLNYNAENINRYKKVCIFESEKSVLQSDSYFGCKSFSVALYGKSMSKEKAKQLLELGIEEVIICLDADYETVTDEKDNFTKKFESFQKNTYRIGKYFKGHCKVSSIVIYDEHPKNCSPTDLGKEQYLELFKNRENLYE